MLSGGDYHALTAWKTSLVEYIAECNCLKPNIPDDAQSVSIWKNIWQTVMKSSRIGQDQKALTSAFS